MAEGHTHGSLAQRAHAAVESSLHSRRARRGTTTARLEDRAKHYGKLTWDLMKRHPTLGIVVAGGTVFAAASLAGAAELAAGAGAAYAAYQVLKKDRPLVAAVEDARRVV